MAALVIPTKDRKQIADDEKVAVALSARERAFQAFFAATLQQYCKNHCDL
jgi:hypothetical protein